MKILIAPYSKVMRNGEENPKNYPYWTDVVKSLIDKDNIVIQLQFNNEKPIDGIKSLVAYSSLKVVETLVDDCDTFISIDNFLPHLAHYRKKYGVVIWGKSDPTLFGYPEHTNLLKDRKYLRAHQFETWEAETFDPKVFVEPQIVVGAVENYGV